MRPRKIQVYYDPPRSNGLRHYQSAGWMWWCRCCDRRGRHSFDRFTDRRRRDLHPFERCWAAVELHLWKHHRKA